MKLFKDDRVCYSHAKFRYEIEIPEEHVKKERPPDLELTSRRQGFLRFTSKAIKKLVDKLETAEEA